VQTSTGFAPGGVKAAGGVRTLDVLLSMVDAGATRFDATTTAAMLDDVTTRYRGAEATTE
jgi:deoxyribose-phosphate aldolase